MACVYRALGYLVTMGFISGVDNLVFNGVAHRPVTTCVVIHRWWMWEEWSCCWVQDVQCTDEPDLVIAAWLLHQTIRPRHR